MKDLMCQTRKGDIFEVSNENDLQLTFDGDLMIVEGKEFLIQTLKKLFFTEKGENSLLPELGTTIYDLMKQWGNSFYQGYLLEDDIINVISQYHYISSNSTEKSEKIKQLVSYEVKEINVSAISLNIILLTEAQQIVNISVLREENL
ncbi:MAG: hypothetical protein QXY18_00960 [Nitrososphaerota archaeon]